MDTENHDVYSNLRGYIKNSIIWNNGDSDIIGSDVFVEEPPAFINIYNNLVEGSGVSDNWDYYFRFYDGGNNIEMDPIFVTPISYTTAPTTIGNLRLLKESLAIDVGANSAVYVSILIDLEPRRALLTQPGKSHQRSTWALPNTNQKHF